MFNGTNLEADVEKCTKYRVTQMKGSACGRCMKIVPVDREDTIRLGRLVELSIKFPSAQRAIIESDDRRRQRQPQFDKALVV